LTKLLISWLINAAALTVAAWVIPGITVSDEQAWVAVAVMAVIFGLINTLIRPFLKLLACPLIILTMGLFALVINGLMLWLSSWIAGSLDVGFHVDGFLAALLGAVVISVVSFVLSLIIGDDGRRWRRRKKRRRDWW
jgi:putative membrane protein